MEIYKNLSLENIENEIWLQVVGYEGLYAVSNMGRVKSLGNNKTRKDKILRQKKDKNGYLNVIFYQDANRKNFRVNRLVAQAFITNPNNLPQVNHIDENKENNVVDNLEWCDAKYNSNYGTCQQRRIDNTDYKTFQSKRVANTDWKTKVANTDYKAIAAKIDYKAIAEKLTNRQDQSKQVYQYSLDGILVAIWESVNEAGRNGFASQHISQCCLGKRKTHKGYIWSYNKL